MVSLRRCEKIDLVFFRPFKDESPSKTSELRNVIMRVTFLGGKPLELLALKPIELKYKRCRSEVFPRDLSLRAKIGFPRSLFFSHLLTLI